MRYLKYFENNNSFYQEITDLEFREILDILSYHGYGDDYETKQLMFDYDEFDHIKKMSMNTPGTIVTVTRDKNSSYFINSSFWKTKYSYILLKIIISNIYKEIYCYKMEDEWYLVNIISQVDSPIQTRLPLSIADKYYKCDQFEGLLKLLNNVI